MHSAVAVTAGKHRHAPGRRVETAAHANSARTSRLGVWPTCLVVIGLLFLAMCAWSTFQWHRGGNAWDISDFNQSTWLILHGDLNPYSSVSGGGTFLQEHFALFLYPLTLVYALYPNGLTLLLLQDLALALASLVAIRWVLEMFERQLDQDSPILTRRLATWCVLGFLVVLVFDPWLWQGISFDFHMEGFAALFLVLAARAFWRQQPTSALIWSALALTTSDYAGLLVLALGLCVVLAGTGVRRWGLVAMAAGAGWLLLVGALGYDRGDNLQAYAYITAGAGGTGTVTTPRLALAMVSHPSRWLTMLGTKPLDLYRNFVPTGVLGMVSPWSFAVVLAVIIPAALLPPPIFLESGFQTIPAEIVGLCGSAFLLLWIARAVARRWNAGAARITVAILALAVFAQCFAVAAVMLPRIPGYWIQVSAPQGVAINKAAGLIPEGAQVVASMPVLGHFSGRRWADALVGPGQSFPIESRTVYFVIAPTAGRISMTPAQSEEAITNAERLGAVPVLTEHGVHVLRWHPGPGHRPIVIVPLASG
ncbi:MAG TPA: DUF2079 domain-containing protein [Acidimicrobiales bacterium]|jgi:hypothetical protein|nr:DUF2079 domain-containing protein [Acidimicrobiales bacterium]